MDLNALLLSTTTATADGGASSEAWIRGKRKRKNAADDTPTRKASKPEVASGLDMAQLQRDTEALRKAADGQPSSSEAGALSQNQVDAYKLAHTVMEYVMNRECGGRHNTQQQATNTSSNSITPSVLAAERSLLRRAARYVISHVVHPSPTGSLASSTRTEPVPDSVVDYRKSMVVCDVRRDLVGGVTSGMSPYSREYMMRLVEAALKGEAYVRPADETTEGRGASSSTGDASSGAKKAGLELFKEDKVASGASAFSLTDFLDGGSSGEE